MLGAFRSDLGHARAFRGHVLFSAPALYFGHRDGERGTAMISIESTGRVMVATLARAPVNAIDDGLIARLDEIIDRVESDETISVLHIRSGLKAFCAGADLALMQSCFSTTDGPDRMVVVVRQMQAAFARLENAPFVTLVEIGGAAVGGGLELALACDLRIAAAEAKLGLTEARLGLLPGAGGTQRLTRLCGRGVANRLILGGELMSGAEAEQFGVVQWSCPRAQLPDRAREIAAHYASMPRPALAAIKRCLAAADARDANGYEEEIVGTRRLYDEPEARRRVAEFLAKSVA
jgi:enoyl-CoA hydratase/carnithine racemase